jgi:hypothetical protein
LLEEVVELLVHMLAVEVELEVIDLLFLVEQN